MKSLVQFINESKESDVLYDIFHVITCSDYDDDLDNNEEYIADIIKPIKEWVKKYDVKKVSYLVDFESAKDMDVKKSDFKGIVKGKIKFVKFNEIYQTAEDIFKNDPDVREIEPNSRTEAKYNSTYFFFGDGGDGWSVLIKKEN